MTAAKNSDTVMNANNIGNNISSSILKGLNLPGMAGLGGGAGGPSVMANMQGLGKVGGAGGYQPKMFGAAAGGAGGISQSMSISGGMANKFGVPGTFGKDNDGSYNDS